MRAKFEEISFCTPKNDKSFHCCCLLPTKVVFSVVSVCLFVCLFTDLFTLTLGRKILLFFFCFLFVNKIDVSKTERITYVSLRLRVQNAVSAQPCVGKFQISLVLLNFLHCNFRLWFETP